MCINGFLRPRRIHIPFGASIGTSAFAVLVGVPNTETHTRTDTEHATSEATGRIYAMHAMRPKTNQTRPDSTRPNPMGQTIHAYLF